MFAIELPDDVEARLEALASKLGRSKADCAREAILRLLEDEEDARTATERLSTSAKRWGLTELERVVTWTVEWDDSVSV